MGVSIARYGCLKSCLELRGAGTWCQLTDLAAGRSVNWPIEGLKRWVSREFVACSSRAVCLKSGRVPSVRLALFRTREDRMGVSDLLRPLDGRLADRVRADRGGDRESEGR